MQSLYAADEVLHIKELKVIYQLSKGKHQIIVIIKLLKKTHRVKLSYITLTKAH